MSGGTFEYNQYKIGYIADSIQSEIDKIGKKISQENQWYSPEFLKDYPQNKYYHIYPKEIVEKFKKAVQLLKEAQIYTHRIDWLLAGDDGEETFLKRLEEDLQKL